MAQDNTIVANPLITPRAHKRLSMFKEILDEKRMIAMRRLQESSEFGNLPEEIQRKLEDIMNPTLLSDRGNFVYDLMSIIATSEITEEFINNVEMMIQMFLRWFLIGVCQPRSQKKREEELFKKREPSAEATNQPTYEILAEATQLATQLATQYINQAMRETLEHIQLEEGAHAEELGHTVANEVTKLLPANT